MRVLIVDDEPLARRRLARMIAKMPDHELWMAFFRDPERVPPPGGEGMSIRIGLVGYSWA